MITFPIFLLVLVGSILLTVSFHYGAQFYPPGYGYAEEKINDRRSTILGILGLLLVVAGAAWAMAS